MIRLLVLSLACVCAYAIPYLPPVTRNTIFAEELLEGGAFENLDVFKTAEATSRTVAVSPYRLPTTTKPTHYDIYWAIDMTNLAYSGYVNIQLHATEANVSQIVIHSDHVTLTSVALRQGTTTSTTPILTTYTTQPEYHFLIVSLSNGVLAFNDNSPVYYTLSVEFRAPMRTDMYGIYQSWYRNNPNDASVSWMATTQFQATSARRAFPCYDEPKFKATFNVTIRRATTFRSWSNTRLWETRNTLQAGLVEDVYHRTPVMSTYHLAMIVANYDTLRVVENNLLKHEVIARPGAITSGQGAYALEIGQKLLAEMSDYTDYNYFEQDPNLKMTHASIPDFFDGAMENWGLLTYREAYLMYDPIHTSSYSKQVIAYILSHEIAHMWFGNLVTNDWWDVLWLNEGFARYYQYFLTYSVEDMGFDIRFITEQVHTSQLSDSANSPHPLTNPGIGSPTEVRSMFSTISYNKGAAIIRMTEHLLGSDVHRRGLRNYLKQKQFQAVQPIDLFNALWEAGNQTGALTAYGSNFDFVEYYRSWTEQSGHPVLNVQVNHTTGEMTIYQRRFNINTGYSSVNTNYVVPITFTTGTAANFANTKPSHILTKAVTVINRGSVGDDWVLFNIQQTGFYRVNYDEYTWNLIVRALRSTDRTRIHEYNRAQIVNDVFQFARSGLMSYRRAFNILSFLRSETAYTPWVAAMTGFNWLRNRLQGTPLIDQLDAKIVEWASTVMNEITYYPSANETFMRSYLRYQLAPFMCSLNVAACRSAATTQFANLRSNNVEVPPDSRNWVYCNALRNGIQADFDFLWNRYQQFNVYTEKILILQNIGCTPLATALNTVMNALIDRPNSYIIRSQDYTSAINSVVSGNEVNTQIAFQFIQNNLQAVINAFGDAATPLSYVSARLRTIEEVSAFQTWATNNQAALGTSYNSVMNGAESARASIQWVLSVQADINSYLVSGDENYVTTTAAPIIATPPVTVTPGDLPRPVTPVLPVPDSAVTTFTSVFVIALAVLINIML